MWGGQGNVAWIINAGDKKKKSILTIHIHTNIKSFILVLRSTISPVEGFL